MDKRVKLTVQEARKLGIIERLERDEITTARAAELMERSERHVRRTLLAVLERGPEALAHGNRGRLPANAISHDIH